MKLVDEGEGFLRINCRGRAGDILMAVIGASAWFAVFAVFSYKYFPSVLPITDNNMPVPLLLVVPLSVAGVLFSAVFFARQVYGKRIVFDKKTRTVTIIRLFSGDTVMSFDSVARVALISVRTPFFKREAYCLVPASAPIFGVKIISPIYKSSGAKIEKFKSGVVPKIENILGLGKTDFAKQNETPVVPCGYKHDGTRYAKSFVCRNIFSIILCAFLLCAASHGMALAFASDIPMNNTGMVIGMPLLAFGFISSLFSILRQMFARVRSVSFDSQRKTIEVRRGIFASFGVRQYPMASLKSFDVRGYIDGWGDHRSVYLRLEGVKKPVPVIYSASRGKETADELKFLSWLSGLDPARDTAYTLYIKYISLFEVP
ncbi:MAG: hypothetical protein LBU26_00460 [Synergistaceae bacterium]|jgi:hypothetical protein|nr:hypothetical protein [Synergistaceae bacterium]